MAENQKQPSSRRRASTRAARTRQADSGEPYSEARRKAADLGVDTVAPMMWPAPVAVMFARHLRAAWNHLGAARRLARDNGAPIEDKRVSFASGGRVETNDGPLATAVRRAHHQLWEVMGWANRTAVESGVIQVVPSPFGGNPQEKAAEQTLYPGAYDQWCERPGKTLPQPGEVPSLGEDEQPAEHRVRHSLPGPVPHTRLRANATGAMVVPARDVVPGTPAHPVWEAHAALNRWQCQWMYRGADSPADLAATVDGLVEVADAFSGVLLSVMEEVSRRRLVGSMTGGDAAAFARVIEQATALLNAEHPDGGYTNQVRSLVYQLRDAIDDVRPAMPAASDTARIPARVRQRAAGKTYAQLREDYGNETFTNRQVERVRPADYSTVDGLRRVLQWMHFTGAQTYDPAAHAAEDPAARA